MGSVMGHITSSACSVTRVKEVKVHIISQISNPNLIHLRTLPHAMYDAIGHSTYQDCKTCLTSLNEQPTHVNSSQITGD